MPTTAWDSAGETEPLFVTVVCKMLDGGKEHCNFVDKLLKSV